LSNSFARGVSGLSGLSGLSGPRFWLSGPVSGRVRAVSGRFEANQRPPDPLHNGSALMRAHRLPQSRTGLLVAQDRLDPIEVLDLMQEPAAHPGGLFPGLIEPAPDMSPAPGQGNGTVASLGKRGVSGVAVALDGAFEK